MTETVHKLEVAVADGVVPGAVAVVGDTERTSLVGAYGVTRLGGSVVTEATRYDLASLTKVVGALPAVLALAEAGELSLGDPVRRFFSQAGWMQTPSLGDATLRQLLTHTAGLPAWKPLFALTCSRLTALGNVLQTPLEHPPGRVVYSDLGFILLGATVERVSGTRLDAFVQRHVFGPLEMTETGYGVPEGAGVAATEDCGWRGRLLEGEVHDENAFVFDGVAGHAGLFGTARDLARYAQAWLRLDAPFASPERLREATREHARGEGDRRALGWALSDEGNPSTYGHTGFTGTSLRLDPAAGRFAVLLSNRVHPSRSCGEGIGALRATFHSSVFGS